MFVCVCFVGKLCICVDIFQCVWADHCGQGEHVFLGIFRYVVPLAWWECSEQRMWEADVCTCSHVSYAALLRRQWTKDAPVLTRLLKVF